MSLPVATSKTKPRNDSCFVTNGLASMRRNDCRTSSSTSLERLGSPLRLESDLVLDLLLEAVVGERQHAAVGVVDEDDLLGAEQPLTDGQRADLVIGHHAAGVADDVRLTIGQARGARYTSSRASMQATTATCLLGGSGSGPLNPAAYASLFFRYSSVTDTGTSSIRA